MKSVSNAIKNFIHEADMFLMVICAISSIFGLLLVGSAPLSSDGTVRLVLVQGFAIFLGLLLFVLFTLIDIEDLTGYWKVILVFNILFVLSTLVFGKEVDGNRSWLEIPVINMRVQPAEIVKITFVLLLAKQMYSVREHISSVKSVLFLGTHLILMIGTIWIASSDMGMSLVYVFIFICMAFAAGVRLWWFLGGAIAVAAAFPYIWSSLGSYQQMRVLVVLDDTLDPLGIGYQASRSKLAIGSGKLFGQGLFNGTQTQRGILPAKHTDFIFAVAGEELGMVGCVAIMILLVMIIIRCLYVAAHAKTGMGSLICVGIAAMLIFQTFENIGMCVGLTPIIGITLPFFSYGGSSIITMFAAMGIVSGIKMRPMPDWLKN